MVDLAGGIEARNYSIRPRADRRGLADLLLTTLSFLMIGAALLFCLWVRSHITQMGYEIQRLQEQQEALERTKTALILQEQTLKYPERLEQIARDELGMSPVRLTQMLPEGVLGTERAGSATLALVSTARTGAGSRRSLPVN
jgi:cell division protein FtsL